MPHWRRLILLACAAWTLLVFGAAGIAVMVLLAVGAPLLAPFDPVRLSLPDRLLAPGATHYFGTDELGRDDIEA